MNIRCPQCQTVFRVDPARIPAGGARARCARCGAAFMVRPPAAQPQAPTSAASRPPSPPASTVTPPPPPPAPTVAPPRAPARQPAAVAASAARTAAATAPAAGTDNARGASPLGSRDPGARAERLARALVSDIVAYHPDRRERSLEEGTLRTEFRDEILKSWEEYVAQVGDGVARSTPFFRDALNTILAGGQELF